MESLNRNEILFVQMEPSGSLGVSTNNRSSLRGWKSCSWNSWLMLSLVLSLIFTSGRLNATWGVLRYEAVHQSPTESLSWLRFFLMNVYRFIFGAKNEILGTKNRWARNKNPKSIWRLVEMSSTSAPLFLASPPNLVSSHKGKCVRKLNFESFSNLSRRSWKCARLQLTKIMLRRNPTFPFVLFLAQEKTSNNALQSLTLKLSESLYMLRFVFRFLPYSSIRPEMYVVER